MSDTAAQAHGKRRGSSLRWAACWAPSPLPTWPAGSTRDWSRHGCCSSACSPRFSTRTSKNPTLALVLALGVGMAADGGIAAYYAISPPVYPTIARGTGVGWMIGSGRIVSILARIASGYLLDAGIGAATLYQIFGGFMAMSGVFVLLLHRTYASESEEMTETIPAARALATPHSAQRPQRRTRAASRGRIGQKHAFALRRRERNDSSGSITWCVLRTAGEAESARPTGRAAGAGRRCAGPCRPSARCRPARAPRRSRWCRSGP